MPSWRLSPSSDWRSSPSPGHGQVRFGVMRHRSNSVAWSLTGTSRPRTRRGGRLAEPEAGRRFTRVPPAA